MMKKDKTKKTIMQICTIHKTILDKGSPLQKEHEEETKEECKWKKYNPKKDNPKYNESEIKKENIPKDTRSKSRMLYDYALSRIDKLYLKDNNRYEVYALVRINEHREIIEITSSDAIDWLTNEYSDVIDGDEIYGIDFYKKVTHAIKSKARKGKTESVKINNRIAQLKDSIWYDLGTDEYKAVKITKKGIEILNMDDRSPFFRRTETTYKQQLPKYDNQNSLKELADLLKIKPNDKVVFISHLVCFFLSSIPVPMMVFDGTAGSIKTSATSTIKKIVDPDGKEKLDNVHAMPVKPDDLITDLYGEYMASFDNVSYIDNETSDIISRAVTGATNTKRKLYENNERVVLKFMSKIVLNGIVPTLEYTDLQTRILNYERLTIDKSNRMLEKVFERKIELMIPNLLGNIFTLLSKALEKYPTLSSKIKPGERMADFEVWGEIISRLSGHEDNEFLDRYYEKLKEEAIKVQESYPIISAIQNLMHDREVYDDSSAELYSKLCHIAENMGINVKDRYSKFPKGSNKLVNHIKSIESNLRTSGFNVTYYYYSSHDKIFSRGTSMIRISRKEKQTSLESHEKRPSTPSILSKKDDSRHKNKDKGVEGSVEGTKKYPRLKNGNSRHENKKVDYVEGVEGTFKKNPIGKTVIKNLERTKQNLRDSNFEIWNNGVVKCKLCNSKMDIPGAANHACKKRQSKTGSESL